MILPTMTDDEKAFEAFRMTNILCEFMGNQKDEVVDKFRRGRSFPYFQRYSMTDDKGNKWHCLYYILTKAQRNRGMYYMMAYITYDIPRKRTENDTNAGRGIIMFDPYAMRRRMEDEDAYISGIVMEITPHAFNRYTERYLNPKGLDTMEFPYKVESMLKRWQWFDVCADMHGDKNAEKHKGENICPYDVIMRGGGMLRGMIVNEMFLKFSTYVSDDMMFANQHERKDEMVGEYFSMKREGLIK